MASITINEVSKPILPSTTITGDEQLVSIDRNGKTSTISVNQLLDKVDDSIADRVEDQVMEQIMENVDEQIEDRIDDVLDNVGKLTWNEVR
jgi:BioD-like phosphotransacetylase family protein